MPPSRLPSHKTSLSRRLSQWICGVHGHDTQLQIDADRLLLRCNHCGYASPGWVVRPPAAGIEPDSPPAPSAPSSSPAPASAQ
jgi:hypothetical protein